MWPRPILDLGKQFNLTIRQRHEGIFARRLEDVLKMSWWRFCKTSWKRFEDVLKRYGQDEYIGLDQDVLKTSSEDEWLRRIYSSWWTRLKDVFKTSSEDEDERRLQDVFIKTNVSLVLTCSICHRVDYYRLAKRQASSLWYYS